jgi:hypothetical protein
VSSWGAGASCLRGSTCHWVTNLDPPECDITGKTHGPCRLDVTRRHTDGLTHPPLRGRACRIQEHHGLVAADDQPVAVMLDVAPVPRWGAARVRPTDPRLALDALFRGRISRGDLLGEYPEACEHAGAERGYDCNVSGVAPARHQDPADTRLIVAGVKCVPANSEIGFKPCAEIHGRRIRSTPMSPR